MQKPLIAVIRGGYSGESVISHQSAACMMKAIDRERFDAVYISIEREQWSCESATGERLELDRGTLAVGLRNGTRNVDATLVVIHGTPGEDGHLQGQLEMLGIPYQTGKLLNMALTFSKFTTTALLRSMGFSVAPSVMLTREMPDLVARAAEVGLPSFVKPDQAGSSLGITKVNSPENMQVALDKAFAECDTVMVEGMLLGRELTCGVIQMHGIPQALPVCEIRTSHEFFDYEAKYHATDTEELVPAPIPDAVTYLVQERSLAIYRALQCRGPVRVDHMWNENEVEKDPLNTIEVNTVPGFSEASILPKMLAAANIGIDAFINDLIERLLEQGSSSV